MENTQPQEQQEQQQQPLRDVHEQPLRDVRLCLVGKTGAGKSTLGNLLCPGANFKTSSGAASVTSTAEQARLEYPKHGLALSLLDTMGLGDTAHRQEVVRQKITEGIMSLVGGVDFFFLCIKKERFTDENYLIVTYLFGAILGEQSLDNLWLVVTHADDLAEDALAQAQWLRDARNNNKKFAEVLRLVGAHKVLFIDNNSSTNPRLDAIYADRRESAKDLLLNVMQNNEPARFTIESLEAAQKEYDDKKAAVEAERAAEVARLKQMEVDAATAIEKEKARSAIREAELLAELKLEKARAELEAKLRAEAEEKLRNVPPPQVVHGGGPDCVLF